MNSIPRLREKGSAAWQQHQQSQKHILEQRVQREPLVLQEKLRAICGDEYEISVDTSTAPIRAEVDGLMFVSTYNEPFSLGMPAEMAEEYANVRLWWRCSKCGGSERSDSIKRDYDLGKQLEKSSRMRQTLNLSFATSMPRG